MTKEERKLLAKEPLIWRGNLFDDCVAEWAGLMLRAELMDEDNWWWAVYDMQKEEATIDDSNNYTDRFIGGEISRLKAESVAQKYIAEITMRHETAKYLIADTFKITGRGLVFSGYLKEGLVSVGDKIEFVVQSALFQRQIIGIEGTTKYSLDRGNTGLLIKCNSEAEIDELRNWTMNNNIAIIYKSET